MPLSHQRRQKIPIHTAHIGEVNSDRYIEFKLNEIIIWLIFCCCCVCERLCFCVFDDYVLMFEENYHLSNVIVWKVMISEFVIQFGSVIEKSNQFQNYHIWNFGHHTPKFAICLFPSLHHCAYHRTKWIITIIRKTNVNLIQTHTKYTKSITKMVHVKERRQMFVLVCCNNQCFWWWTINAIPIFSV